MFARPTAVIFAVLAALAQAAPTPTSDVEARNPLMPRATCTPNGAAIFYPETGFGGSSNALAIFAFQDQQAFCQQFQPVRKGGLSFKSYTSSDILVGLYRTSDCSGNVGYTIGPAAGNATNQNAVDSGFFSFQAVYVKNN